MRKRERETSDRGQVNHLWEQSGGLASEECGETPRFNLFMGSNKSLTTVTFMT